jgi:hypothetical protein
MTTDDVLEWIAIKTFEMHTHLTNMTAFEKANEEREKIAWKLDILEELRLHILAKTNPHNREDLK